MFNKLCNKIEPVDVIATITIIGGLILKFNGADGVVSSIMIMVVAYYFGKKGIGSIQEAENKNPTI